MWYYWVIMIGLIIIGFEYWRISHAYDKLRKERLLAQHMIFYGQDSVNIIKLIALGAKARANISIDEYQDTENYRLMRYQNGDIIMHIKDLNKDFPLITERINEKVDIKLFVNKENSADIQALIEKLKLTNYAITFGLVDDRMELR